MFISGGVHVKYFTKLDVILRYLSDTLSVCIPSCCVPSVQPVCRLQPLRHTDGRALHRILPQPLLRTVALF